MPKVLFWNVARAGAGDAGEQLKQSLAALASKSGNPDAIIVAEMKKVEKLVKHDLSPEGYVYAKPDRPIISGLLYGGGDDLRYLVFTKLPGAQTMLIPTGQSRPMILLALSSISILVTHNPSVTASSKPQAQAMIKAYEHANELKKLNKISNVPVSFFGDLNVDRKDPARMQSLYKHLATAKLGLETWNDQGTGYKTQDKGGELDWALCDLTFNPTLTCVELGGANVKKHSTSKTDENWTMADAQPEKKSDHKPIILQW